MRRCSCFNTEIIWIQKNKINGNAIDASTVILAVIFFFVTEPKQPEENRDTLFPYIDFRYLFVFFFDFFYFKYGVLNLIRGYSGLIWGIARQVRTIFPYFRLFWSLFRKKSIPVSSFVPCHFTSDILPSLPVYTCVLWWIRSLFLPQNHEYSDRYRMYHFLQSTWCPSPRHPWIGNYGRICL